MGRTTEDAKITTKAERERLAPRHEPYWRTIEGGLALGYRKGPGGGVWVVRRREAGGYRKSALGRADDVVAATVGKGETLPSHETAAVLNFAQAQTEAKNWAQVRDRVAAGLEAAVPAAPAKPYTVADAIEEYLSDYAARGGKALALTKGAAEAHILPALGTDIVARLTRDQIRRWHRGIASAPARVRAARGKINIRRQTVTDDDAPRRRRATANRILTVLKAALNHARREGKITCPDDAWSAVSPFKGADAPKIRYLNDAEATRLINACAGDFRDLVMAGLLTGCRYGELAKLKVGDFDRKSGTLSIPVTKGGKARHVVLTDEGQEFFTRLATGRTGSDLMLMRDAIAKQATRDRPAQTTRAPWAKGDQSRPMREACTAAQITPAISFHILRHTYGSRLAMRGVGMAVIAAQLGHTGTRMTERHYAHLAPSYVADVVRSAFGSLGVTLPATNVTPMAKAGS